MSLSEKGKKKCFNLYWIGYCIINNEFFRYISLRLFTQHWLRHQKPGVSPPVVLPLVEFWNVFLTTFWLKNHPSWSPKMNWLQGQTPVLVKKAIEHLAHMGWLGRQLNQQRGISVWREECQRCWQRGCCHCRAQQCIHTADYWLHIYTPLGMCLRIHTDGDRATTIMFHM